MKEKISPKNQLLSRGQLAQMEKRFLRETWIQQTVVQFSLTPRFFAQNSSMDFFHKTSSTYAQQHQSFKICGLFRSRSKTNAVVAQYSEWKGHTSWTNWIYDGLSRCHHIYSTTQLYNQFYSLMTSYKHRQPHKCERTML